MAATGAKLGTKTRFLKEDPVDSGTFVSVSALRELLDLERQEAETRKAIADEEASAKAAKERADEERKAQEQRVRDARDFAERLREVETDLAFDLAQGDRTETERRLAEMDRRYAALLEEAREYGIATVELERLIAERQKRIREDAAAQEERDAAKQFAEFEIVSAERDGATIVVLVVDGARVPIVFSKPGTYSIGGGRQKTAFAQGTVYFRHGAKSEPATTDDLAAVIDRGRKEERDHLLDSVQKVFAAPQGHQVVMVPCIGGADAGATGGAIRLTDDPAAPQFRHARPDDDYPHRQKEVVEEVNRRLGGRHLINSYDVQCVRRVHGVDESKPELSEKRRYSSRQYTDRFVEWLMEQYEADPEFFANARSAYHNPP